MRPFRVWAATASSPCLMLALLAAVAVVGGCGSSGGGSAVHPFFEVSRSFRAAGVRLVPPGGQRVPVDVGLFVTDAEDPLKKIYVVVLPAKVDPADLPVGFGGYGPHPSHRRVGNVVVVWVGSVSNDRLVEAALDDLAAHRR